MPLETWTDELTIFRDVSQHHDSTIPLFVAFFFSKWHFDVAKPGLQIGHPGHGDHGDLSTTPMVRPFVSKSYGASDLFSLPCLINLMPTKIECWGEIYPRIFEHLSDQRLKQKTWKRKDVKGLVSFTATFQGSLPFLLSWSSWFGQSRSLQYVRFICFHKKSEGTSLLGPRTKLKWGRDIDKDSHTHVRWGKESPTSFFCDRILPEFSTTDASMRGSSASYKSFTLPVN